MAGRTAPRSTVRLLALAVIVAAMHPHAPAFAQTEERPPASVQTQDVERVYVDTEVAEVYIAEDRTVAIMNQSPDSRCPSDEYVFERERPKWLAETGRLLVAQEQDATIRVSFSCYGGVQSINAIQFLSPPGPRVATGTPSRERAIRTTGARPVPLAGPAEAQAPVDDTATSPSGSSGASLDGLPPVPTPAPDMRNGAGEAVRRIPLP